MKVVVRRADGAIYVTEDHLQREFPTIGIAAYASNVELCWGKRQLSKGIYEITSIPKIGLIGSFGRDYKGIDVAIRALSILRDRGLDCALHVLGSGDSTPYLALATHLGCANRVQFDGTLGSAPEVMAWLDSLDLYIQPSLIEGLPRALIEAMSRGLPCVASNVGGIPELIPPEWLVSPRDAESLATKLGEFLRSETARVMAGRRNLKKAARYSVGDLRARRGAFWSKAALIAQSGTRT